MYIYIRNLSPVTSLSDLEGLFTSFGLIQDITISSYVVNDERKCTGSIELISESQGLKAISSLHNKVVDGNILLVEQAS